MKRQALVILGTVALAAGAASAQFSDNFDSYANGSVMAGQGGWEVWCTGGESGVISNTFAHSAPHSLRIDTNDDTVHRFTGATSGQWVYKTWVYVPSNAGGTGNRSGWINLMNTYCDGAAQAMHWSTATTFAVGTGLVQSWGGAGTLALITDQWVEYRCEIDLATDTYDEYYNGQVLSTNLPWTTHVGPGGRLEVAAVDLYSDTIDAIYFDDVTLQAAGGGCYPDCDGNGTLNVNDYICFQTKFALGDPYADCDNNGVRNVNDYICFQTKFALGC